MPNVSPRPVVSSPEVAVRPRCPECGHKIRGKNHKAGEAHDRGVMRRQNRKLAS